MAEVVSSDINTTSWYTFDEDIDDDGIYTDSVRVAADGTALEFNFSSAAADYNYTITDISDADSGITFDVPEGYISQNNKTFGKISINGTTSTNLTMLAGMITVYPYLEGDGFFTVEYLQEGTNFIAGNIQKGDLIKLCYEAPQDIGEDAEVRLNFIPKIGTATLTEFVTPDVISTERTYLYP